jgi:YhcH/YjgK/YiaL family protein
MIYGNIKSLDKKETYPQKVYEALQYLKENDMNNVEPGRIVLDGEKMYITVVDTMTEAREKRKAETHNNYLDIQFLAKGEEAMGVGINIGNAVPATEYDETKDITFYNKVPNENYINMSEGDFVVLYPNDIHRPKCAVNEEKAVRKVVVKIHMDLI